MLADGERRHGRDRREVDGQLSHGVTARVGKRRGAAALAGADARALVTGSVIGMARVVAYLVGRLVLFAVLPAVRVAMTVVSRAHGPWRDHLGGVGPVHRQRMRLHARHTAGGGEHDRGSGGKQTVCQGTKHGITIER